MPRVLGWCGYLIDRMHAAHLDVVGAVRELAPFLRRAWSLGVRGGVGGQGLGVGFRAKPAQNRSKQE